MQQPAVRCQHILVNGHRCKRKTRIANGRCYQHTGRVAQVRPAQPVSTNFRTFAQNNQNIHTISVVKDMNPILKRLLEAPMYDSKQLFVPIFKHLPYTKYISCINSVFFFALTKGGRMSYKICDHIEKHAKHNFTVPAYGNNTFYKMLLHAVSVMETDPRGAEMWKRFFQEMEDSVVNCLHGTMSRLLNTFSGFFEDVAMPVPKSTETLQAKIGAIAGRDGPTEERREAARVALREEKIPESEWAVWVDAIE